MIRRPGITDVAARAGVSIKTVSRVVNDEAAVRPETRERVLAAVEELGYVPSTAARSLKSGTGRAVGVVIDSLADPFFAAIAAAIEQRAVAEGLTILVASSERDEERERDLLLSFLGGHKVMGVIFAPMASDYPYLDAFRGSAPLVAIDRAVTGIDSVVIDDEGAARQAAEYLVGLGHRRIAFIDNDPRFLTVRRRVIGYRPCSASRASPTTPDSWSTASTACSTTRRRSTACSRCPIPPPPSSRRTPGRRWRSRRCCIAPGGSASP